MKWATTLVLCTSPIFAPQIAVSQDAGLNEADSKFVAQEVSDGVAGIKFAELAVDKTENPEIKALAESIATDHTKANKDLLALAKTNDLEVNSDISEINEENFEKMEKLSGAEFDKSYLAYVIDGHKDAISKFEKSAKSESNAELKTWTTSMIPGLKAHLARAEKIQPVATGAVSNNRNDKSPGAKNTGQNNADRDSNSTDKLLTADNNAEDLTNRDNNRVDKSHAADNTAQNKGDNVNSSTKTAMDQSNSSEDIDTTAEIRRAITSDDNMSVNAQNVKIITDKGKVTLRGPVDSAAEKSAIGEIADRVATAANVENQLEVK